MMLFPRVLLVAACVSAAALPNGLEWRQIGAREIQTSLHNLLRESYITTDDESLRLDYPPAMLSWMLSPPGADEDLRIGIGEVDSDALVGFMCAVPTGLLINGCSRDKLFHWTGGGVWCGQTDSRCL